MLNLRTLTDIFLNPRTWVGAFVYAVVIFIAAWVAARVIRIVARRALDRRAHLDRGVVQFMTQFAQAAAWIVAVMMFLHIIPALQQLGTALLTGVSVASVVIGLAAQNTLGNFIAGLSLVLYRPFEVDDVVTITGPNGATTGVIEQLALGYTVLRTFDDRRLIVPNNTMATQVALTSNHAQLRHMAIVSAVLPNGENIDVVRKTIQDAASKDPEVISVISCLEMPLDTPAKSLSLRMWCRGQDAATKVPERIIKQLREQMAENGMDILLPLIEDKKSETAPQDK